MKFAKASGPLLACLLAALPPQDAAADEPAASCVAVEVNGERTPAFDCLTRKLIPVPARGAAPVRLLAAERIGQRPTNELGQVNQAATQHRMGNAWGRGVIPQRPADGR